LSFSAHLDLPGIDGQQQAAIGRSIAAGQFGKFPLESLEAQIET